MATDVEIWDCAAEHGLVTVSKDADFRQLAFVNGPSQKVVWLRLGNVFTLDIPKTLPSPRRAKAAFSSSVSEALLVMHST